MKYNHTHNPSPISTGNLAFVFSGIGSEWKGMGLGLFQTEAVFKKAIKDFDQCLRQYTDYSIVEEITKGEETSLIVDSSTAHIFVVAFQIALAGLLHSWGIQPDAVLGHSVGEVTAACSAGVLTLEDTIQVLWHQHLLIKNVAGKGRMAHISLPAEELRELLTRYKGHLSVSAVNSDNATVITGKEGTLLEFFESLEERGVFCRMIQTDVPFHSPEVEPHMGEVEKGIREFMPQTAKTPIYSTLRGGLSKPGDFDASHWTRHIRDTVLFAPAINAMIRDGYNIFIEISPHPIVSSYIHERA